MAFYQQPRSLPERFQLIFSSFLQKPGLPFADALPEEKIKDAFNEEGVSFAEGENDVFTPMVTLWAFLSQVLFKDEQRSCFAAVSRVAVLLIALGKEPCSRNTGAYCRARAKLPETVIRRLTSDVASRCQRQVPSRWLWHGRHVHLVDGTTVSMPDTPANQIEYPQPATQKKGLGFPIARMVVLLSLATGMLGDMAMGPYSGKETGETALLRQLLGRFQKGDILLADRYYCSYFMIALLKELGVDFVVRIHQHRQTDFRRGEKLGKGDHVIQWMRPGRPDWMDQQTYDRMPDSIEVRQVEIQVHRPGYRVKTLVVATTLTDARKYTSGDVAQLYHYRWHVELDIRAIKITLGLDVLRCKTPEMVRKEAWTCLLAYNLLRQTMLQSAERFGLLPRQLSITAAMQSIASNWGVVLIKPSQASQIIEDHLKGLASRIVGNRPDRVEPRAIKRRPKCQALLRKPRDQARAELLARTSS